MHPLANALLKTGLAVKLDQVKRATSSYARDRVEQSQGAAISYALAVGLYAAAGIFAIALLLVGVTALFRWVELRYGLFEAFGASAAVLLVLVIACAAMAASRLKKPARKFPSLSSRLRVAISATPGKYSNAPARNVSARDTATAVLSEPSTPVNAPRQFTPGRAPRPPVANGGQIKAGLVLAATLAGWALARRRSLSARPVRPAPRPAAEGNA